MIPHIMVSAMAMPKHGKTHFAMTFPDPIAVFSFDMGADFVRGKFPDKKIDIFKYSIPLEYSGGVHPWAKDLYYKIKDEYIAAVTKGGYKTVVLDPATVLWEIVRHGYAVEEGIKGIKEYRYEEPNSRMTGFLMQPLLVGVNLVTLSHLKSVYVNDANTGEKDLDGFKRTNNIADIVMLLERRSREFFATIMDCRFDPLLNDEELQSPSYDDLIALLGWGK